MASKSSKTPRSPEDILKNVEVGGRIKALRLQKGFTQSYVSLSVGASENACAQWETGRAMPKFNTLQKVAEVLDTSTNWLMNGDSAEEGARAQTELEREHLLLLREILEENLATVTQIMRVLANNNKKNS